MRSSVIIEKIEDGYLATASGKNGEGYVKVNCGSTVVEAAAWASSAMVAYALNNDEGGELLAPDEVMAHVPQHLRDIDAKPERVRY